MAWSVAQGEFIKTRVVGSEKCGPGARVVVGLVSLYTGISVLRTPVLLQLVFYVVQY